MDQLLFIITYRDCVWSGTLLHMCDAMLNNLTLSISLSLSFKGPLTIDKFNGIQTARDSTHVLHSVCI